MAAYRGGFEDPDDEDSCMPCLKTKKFQVGNLESLLRIVCLARKKPSSKVHSTQHTLSDAFAVSGLKAPFSMFRSRRDVLYFEPRVLIVYCLVSNREGLDTSL